MVKAGISPRAPDRRQQNRVLFARSRGGGACRCAAHDALGGGGRIVAALSRRCRGRDRQCADGAVPAARNPRRGCGQAGVDPRLSGRVLSVRRRPRRHSPALAGASSTSRCTGAAAAAPSPRPRSMRWRARDDAVARGRRHRRGRPRRACPGAARALVDTAEVLVGGARHLAMVPGERCRADCVGPPARQHDRGDRGAAGPAGDGFGERRAAVVRRRRHAGTPFSVRGNDDRAASGRVQPRRRPARLAARRLHDDQPALRVRSTVCGCT